MINLNDLILFQYLLNSKCDIIKCCCGLIDIHRVVNVDIDKDQNLVKDKELGQL